MWIEITVNLDGRVVYQSRPVRALWIEMFEAIKRAGLLKSRPVRALWIEIPLELFSLNPSSLVEAREGLVD